MLSNRQEGVILACGRATDHQLGFVTNEKVQWLFRPIRTISRIIKITAGTDHSLALDALGRVHSWGSGKFGKLGQGDEHFRAVPTIISDLKDEVITEISAGMSHSVCTASSGKVFSWGENSFGQLGLNNSCPSSQRPRECSISRRGQSKLAVTSISAGSRHTLVLLSDGSVLGCGSNAFGELGISGQRLERNLRFIPMDEIEWEDEPAIPSPQDRKQSSLTQVVGIRAGVDSSVIWNRSGACMVLGLGQRPSRVRFKSEFMVNVVDCSMSRNFMLLLASDGRLFFRERKGRRGTDTDATQSLSSSREKFLVNFAGTPEKATSASLKATSMITKEPQMKGFWGQPVRIDEAFPNRIVKISCSENHSCVVDDSGRLFSWGKGEGLGQKFASELNSNEDSVGVLLPHDRRKLLAPCDVVSSGAFQVACGTNYTLTLIGFERDQAENLVSVRAGKPFEGNYFDFSDKWEDEEGEVEASNERIVEPIGEFPSLVDLAEAQLIRTMDCFNFHKCFEVADAMGLEKLLKATERFILNNVEMLTKLNAVAMRMFDMEDEDDAKQEDDCDDDENANFDSALEIAAIMDRLEYESFDENQAQPADKRMGEELVEPAKPETNTSASSSQQSDTVKEDTPIQETVEIPRGFACTLCGTRFKSRFAREVHFAGSKHQQAVSKASRNRNEPTKAIQIKKQSQRVRKQQLREQNTKSAIAKSASLQSISPPSKPKGWQNSASNDTGSTSSFRRILEDEAATAKSKAELDRKRQIEARKQQFLAPSPNSSGLPRHTQWVESSPRPFPEKVQLRSIINSESEKAKADASKSSSKPLQKSAWGYIAKNTGD